MSTETKSSPLKTNTRSDQVADNVIDLVDKDEVDQEDDTSRKRGREPEVASRPYTSCKDMSEEEKKDHRNQQKRESKAKRKKNRS